MEWTIREIAHVLFIRPSSVINSSINCEEGFFMIVLTNTEYQYLFSGPVSHAPDCTSQPEKDEVNSQEQTSRDLQRKGGIGGN